MQKGVELAYKSVMRPVEGTILTVARKMAEASGEAVAVNAEMDLENLLKGGTMDFLSSCKSALIKPL